ncbi:MAG: hypothetical protein MUF52_01800 [Syntrophobacteraceae bacterium]|nr:hypothetical protein [Syntrophobacteraceae bacterium]
MAPVLGTRMARGGLVILLMTTISLGLVSCTHSPGLQREPVSEKPEGDAVVDAKLWEAGMLKFRAGDYDDALIDFDALRSSAQSERYARLGAYASACMRLILAQSAEDFQEALKLWESWSQGVSSQESEDPRLLAPLLQKVALLGHPANAEVDCARAEKPRKRPQARLEWLSRDLAAYKGMAQAREKESERLKTRLDTKEREIRRLKQQIESLEAIHLKFQERQKEISSP